MKKYVMITDSTTDLPSDYAIINDLVVVPLGFSIDGKNYKDYLDYRDLSINEFYQKIKEGFVGKTSQVNPDEFYQVFEKYAKDDVGILGIFFSSGLSGTFNSARIAKEQIIEKYPNAKIKIIDSLSASLGEGLLVHYAIKAFEDGKTLDENYDHIEQLKLHVAHWFTVSDIDNLKRGGRVSASSAFFAKTLHINPVLHVSNEGKLVARMKKIGRKAAISALVDRMVEVYDKNKNDVIFICHSEALDEVNTLKEMIKSRLGIDNILVNSIGPVIGSHTGIGTIGLFYIATER